MEKSNIFRVLLFLSVCLCGLSVSAQVPSTMDYQIMAVDPQSGQVMANEKLTVRMELHLNAEDGDMVWSQETDATSSNAGVCTIRLDFKDVDWSLGKYFLKAYVNGRPVGASQVNSVPYALMAGEVSGVVTKSMLCGSWKSRGSEKDSEAETYTFRSDGTFAYGYADDLDPIYAGTWTINNLGYVTFRVTEGEKAGGKYVAFAVYDEVDHSICLGGCDSFLGDNVVLYKQQ